MQDRSIRSFTLDYYRKRGAEIRPLAGDETFEITPREGAALKVTFAHETEKDALAPLTATSPQWRAILEDLTADVAVSYRYLVSGPISSPTKTLGAALPDGWAVTSARLLGVDHRVAVGFTHRVTFDSPALNACQEMIHHHLWDVADGERLTSIESRLYELPSIMIKPERFPEEATVQLLLGRSLSSVDEASDTRGREIERELSGHLEEAEKRTNQYFEQQMGNVLNREVTLSDKLDSAIRKLSEAKTPEQIGRYRADGESLQLQLENMRARRELELAAIESACTVKLAQEREKHELTATTDMVALCHASYDVLSYATELVSPDGQRLAWTVGYCPVAGEIRLPACPCCDGALGVPVAIAGGRYACAACTTTCPGCGSAHETQRLKAGQCALCNGATCSGCEASCVHCAESACITHTQSCDTCEAPVCSRCAASCHTCAGPLCPSHTHFDVASGQAVCAAHRPTDALIAPAMRPGPVTLAPPPAPAVVQLASAVLGEAPAEAPLEDMQAHLETTAESVGLGGLFTRHERLFSGVSGRELHPKHAETCHSCTQHFAVQEMVNCETCGVPACPSCIDGETGPCPACDALEAVGPEDPRVQAVLGTYPKLARGQRQWEVAEVGPYILTHWSRLGTWGMVVFHQSDEGSAVITEFYYGRLQTLRQTIGSWLG